MKYIKYIIGSLIVIIPCIITVLIYNDKITENAPKYYKQGVEFYEKGDYANAYYNFCKISKISPLYGISLYKQGKSAQKAGDYKMAALKYELFLKKVPNSIFTKSATVNAGKSYYYSKQYDKAQSIFEELKKETSNKKGEEIYFLGLIAKEKGEKEKAIKYLTSYLTTELGNEQINNIYILRAAEELTTYEKELSEQDKKNIGIAYYRNQKYQKGLNYFSKLPINICWDYLVLSNHYAGNKVIAKKLIEKGFSTFGNTVEENNIQTIYEIYASYLSGNKLKNWSQVYKYAKDNKLAGFDYVLYKLATIIPENTALNLYKEIEKEYPGSKYAPESMWHIFWNKYTTGQYKEAEEIAINHLKRYEKVKSTPRMMFWLAKIYIKENRLSEAHAYLTKLMTKYADDYYGLRAESIIEKRSNFWNSKEKERIPEQKENIEFPIISSKLDIKDLKLINNLFSMGDYEIWLDADFNNKVVESWFEQKEKNKASSIVLARNALEEMEIKPPYASTIYKLAYPRYYINEINKLSAELELNPYIVIALIREESYFKENAKSIRNATGLMQIMPETAKYIITKYNIDTSKLKNLEDPNTNLIIGCNYLNYLENRFNNNILTIAAYNGGEGSVTKWLKTYKTTDSDEFIESIPIAETRNYVKKVFRSYHMYKKIY